ncbi:tetratricopeptide (TPR) repeat protein [Luteimonas sp. RC10]|nr:tetratricopeptide (TPR) repeat protein [Luteimonas sp. RC10]
MKRVGMQSKELFASVREMLLDAQRSRTFGSVALLGALVAAAGSAPAAVMNLPAIPDKPQDEQFVGVRAPWRDYLIAVRAARQIDDPLARCLAWPDLPDIAWPAGHAAAHCHYHFANAPSPAQTKALLDAGQVDVLEAQLAAVSAGHGQREEAERIHTFVHDVAKLPDGERDALTAQWIEAAPDSAFASMMRGHHYSRMGWAARGVAWASETTPAQIEAMEGHFVEAVQLYGRAIELDPALTQAYIGLMEIAKAVSDRDLEAWAFAQAQLAGPACAEVALSRMGALQPRWGGSLQAMAQYAQTLAPNVEMYPLQANQLAAPYVEAVRIEMAEDRYTQGAADVIEDAVRMASNEDALARAAQLSLHRSDGSSEDGIKGLALLLQRERFTQLTPWQARQVASRLVRGEPEWAFATAADAVARSPDDAYGQYLLAAASYSIGRFELAEAHYQLARKDPRQEQVVLRELVTMWMYDAGLPTEDAIAKASPYLDALLEKYPRDGRAHILDWSRRESLGQPISRRWFENFLEVADSNDPLQVQAIENVKHALAE